MDKIFGTLSLAQTYYNMNNKILYVGGWFLSENMYEKILVNGKEAQINVERKDVHNSFPQYSSKCGFLFEEKNDQVISNVNIKIYTGGGYLTYEKNYDVPCVSYDINDVYYKKIVLVGVDDSIDKFFYNHPKLRYTFCLEEHQSEQLVYRGLKVVNNETYNVNLDRDIVYILGEKKKGFWMQFLRNHGLHEFSDFYCANALSALLSHKKMVLLNGNCHMTRIESGLLHSSFKDDYFIYHIPLIYLNKAGYIEDDVTSNADVFIHQDIKEENKFGIKLSDKYLASHIKSTCQNISMPNLFGLGRAFFPQAVMSNGEDHIWRNGIGLFPYRDNVIEEYIDNNTNISIDDLEKVLDEETVKKTFEKYISMLEMREQECSIKVKDYILAHYENERLFWDAGHPTNYLISEICRQILKLLNIEKEEISSIENEMDTYQMPVYDMVKKVLKINWNDDCMRMFTNNKFADIMDKEEYVREYLFWCKNMRVDINKKRANNNYKDSRGIIVMKSNVLIFPAGEINSIELHEALSHNVNINVYGASSINRHGPYVFKNYKGTLPLISQSNFFDEFNQLIEEWNIDVVFPTHDSVVLFLRENQDRINAKVIAADLETSEVCRDKKLTYDLFKDCSFCPTVYHSVDEFPCFVKPREGQGAQGAKCIKKVEDIPGKFQREEYVITEYMPGEELTVDCITDNKGCLKAVLPRVRNRLMAGVCISGTSMIATDEIKHIAEIINDRLGFLGLWYFQVKKDIAGNYKLLEISTRCAGTMGLSRARGVNLPLLSVYAALGNEISVFENPCKVTMDRTLISRYKLDYAYETVYIDYDDTIVEGTMTILPVIRFLYQCYNKGINVVLLTRHEVDHTDSIDESLKKHCISRDLFSEIKCLTFEQEKYDSIKGDKAIFIDNAYAERKKVHEKIGIPVFDVEGIEVLLDWKS